MKSYWSAIWLGGLVGMSAALVPLSSSRAQDVKASATSVSAAISMDHVEIAHPEQNTLVRIQGTGHMSYHVTRLADPPRVVVDFDGAHVGVAGHAAPSDFDPIRTVRLGQYSPKQARLVIDLRHPTKYSVQTSGDDLLVTFADPAAPIRSASLVAHKQSESAPQPLATAGAHSRLANFVLPVSLTQALAAPKSDESTVSASSKQSPAQPGSNPTLSARAAAAAPPAQQLAQAPPLAPQRYSGEPISVNLKDVDLKDFFRLIHEISGLNVVLDPSVHGNVTLVLDEVPWDQALDIVLRNNGLSKQIDGNVLRIASQDTVKHEAEQRRDLAKAEAEAVDPITSTRILSYAKASELVVPLRRFLSARGDIVAQDRSNMLIIRDIPSVMPQIDNLLRQLDRKTQQVEIQARVVQASRSFARDVGTQFGFAVGNSNYVVGGDPIATQVSPLVHPTTPPLVVSSNSIPLISNFPANAPTSGLSFGYNGPNFALDYIITAAEASGVGKLLSSPQLVTQNNAQAIVKQGTQIPIQTTINNTISVQYVDAVLKLQVTPQITAEGTVFMDVTVENTQVDSGIASINGVPALSTQSAQTKVLIGDGGTVVVGGVMVSNQQTNVQQVPLVGSIPIIGHLFKRNSVSVESQELLFFLTPRILPG
jgi:type IV pilus assembly protein PilQ